MKKGWLAAAIILALFGAFLTINAVWSIAIGWPPDIDPELRPGYQAGSLMPGLLFLAGAYGSWRKAKQPT